MAFRTSARREIAALTDPPSEPDEADLLPAPYIFVAGQPCAYTCTCQGGGHIAHYEPVPDEGNVGGGK